MRIGSRKRILARLSLHICTSATIDSGTPDVKTKDANALPRRDCRGGRLTVDLPPGILTALKVHAARRGTTIKEVVTDLVQTALNRKNPQ